MCDPRFANLTGSSALRLPELLIANKDLILAKWQALANAMVTASCKPDADNLRRYASDMLDTLADRVAIYGAASRAISGDTYLSFTTSDGHADGGQRCPTTRYTLMQPQDYKLAAALTS